SPSRGAADLFELAFIFRRGNWRKARERFQPFDDAAVIGAVAERIFGRAPRLPRGFQQRGTRVGRRGKTRGKLDVAAHDAEPGAGLESPGDAFAAQRFAGVAT